MKRILFSLFLIVLCPTISKAETLQVGSYAPYYTALPYNEVTFWGILTLSSPQSEATGWDIYINAPGYNITLIDFQFQNNLDAGFGVQGDLPGQYSGTLVAHFTNPQYQNGQLAGSASVVLD